MASISPKHQTNLERPATGSLRRRSLEILVWIGIILTLLVPTCFERGMFFPFFASKGFLFLAAVQFTFAAWGLLLAFEPEFRPKLDAVSLAVFGFLACLALSAALSPDPARSLWSTYERMSGLVVHAHLGAFFLILASFLRRESDWLRFFFASAAIASYVAILGLLDNHGASAFVDLLERLRLAPDGFSADASSGSTLGNTSFLGSYLQINAFFAIFLVLSTKAKLRMVAALALAVISSGILLNPGGRAMKASFLLGVCGVVVFVFLLGSKSPGVRKIAFASLLASVPIALLCGILVSFNGDLLLASAMDVRGVPERVAVWKAATAGFLEKPILGWGLENFDLMFYRHFDPSILVGPGRSIGPLWFDRAHNIVLDLLVTVGVVGLAAFSLTMAASVFALGGAVRRNGFPGSTGFVVFTALFLSHFVQNLTVFDTVTSLMLLYASFAYASHAAPGFKIPSPGFQNSVKTKRALVLAWACLIPLLALAYPKCVHFPRAVGRVVGSLDGRPQDSDALADYIAASGSATVGKHQVRVRLARLAVNRLSPTTDSDFGKSRLREVDYVLAELEKSAAESPTNFQIPFTAGGLAAKTSVWLFENFSGTDWSAERALRYVNASISSYRRALERCNNHAFASFELSRALVYKGYISGDPVYFGEALDTADGAIKMEPRLFVSHDLAVDIAANLIGDRQLAMERVDRAILINPTWRNSLLEKVREMDR